MDKLREERKELVVKEKEERGRLEDKFINLIKERGKRIAFYFIEQFQNFKKKQKKKGRFQNFFTKKIESLIYLSFDIFDIVTINLDRPLLTWKHDF